MDNKLLTTEEVAEFLGVPVQTIYVWRTKKSGPKSIKVGKHLRFRQADIDAWLDEQASA
jgi:excisionase family DNA binding protein